STDVPGLAMALVHEVDLVGHIEEIPSKFIPTMAMIIIVPLPPFPWTGSNHGLTGAGIAHHDCTSSGLLRVN
ncbi:MAG: hypothetical protein JXA45_02600, partial [Methanomassiliicoccales archaeon]|nr:hypothetical protein [Methanomassiliicoccales archaeon]